MPISGLGMTFKIALRNLLQHRRRTLFLGMALAAVTALMILMGGLAAGVRHTMLHTATTLSTGHLNVGGFFKVTAGQSAPVVTKWEEVLQVVKKSMPEMKYAVQRGRGVSPRPPVPPHTMDGDRRQRALSRVAGPYED